MSSSQSRRRFLATSAGAASLLGLGSMLPAASQEQDSLSPAPSVTLTPTQVHSSFPSQDPQLVKETVLFAHSDLDKVRSLVSASPALANAAIDWGFGDWESAVGAAAHMGRRDIATLLLEHGARPDLFTHAMLGHLPAVQASLEAVPGIEGQPGPHGITLLTHARAGGPEAASVLAYLEEHGGADPSTGQQALEHPAAAYIGTFAWGAGSDDRLEIVETSRGLGLKRGVGFPRGLVHLGASLFYPGGGRAVKIQFSPPETGKDLAAQLTIIDGPLKLVAQRVSS